MPDKTIRWGVIGAGDVFEHKSGPALYQTPNSELVAVMRTSEQKAKDVAQRHGAKHWYTDAASLVTDPDVNAVYIASPHYLHPEHVALAARAHKIVLCEKPMGASVAQAQACVDVCKAHHVPLAVPYYRRSWQIVKTMQKYLRDGAIGEIVTARAQLSDWYSGDERTWLNSFAKSGGDALANSGAHWIDLIRYLLGEVKDVMAYCATRRPGFETDDTATVQLRMHSGALVSFISTRQTAASTNELDIMGTEGRLFASPLSDGRLILQRRGIEPEMLHLPRTSVMHSAFIAELVPCLLNDQPPPIPGEEAVAVWKIMEAAYRSAAEGVRVAV